MGILRLILALSVVIEHTSSIFGIELVGGRLAVQSFYMISGFYMTLILKEKYIGVNDSYSLFITNRLMRLFPIYWVVLLLTIFLSFIDYYYSSGTSFGKITHFITYFQDMSFFSFFFLIFSNIFLIFQDWIMFLGIDLSTQNLFFTTDFSSTDPVLSSFLLIPPAWTLGLEITFYLIAPFIVRKDLKWILLIILASFVVRLILISNGLDNDPWTYRFFPAELMFFLLGTVAYSIYKRLKYNFPRKKILMLILFSGIFFTFCYSSLSFNYQGVVYLFFIFICIPFIFQLSKNWKLDRMIGELSYPVYISHWLILLSIGYLGLSESYYYGFIVSLIAIVFSLAINKVLSSKIEAIRQNMLK